MPVLEMVRVGVGAGMVGVESKNINAADLCILCTYTHTHTRMYLKVVTQLGTLHRPAIPSNNINFTQ